MKRLFGFAVAVLAGLCLLATEAASQVTIPATSFTFPSPAPTTGEAYLACPGDTFQIKFQIKNETAVPVVLTALRFKYEAVNSTPASEFSDVASTHFEYFGVFDDDGDTIAFTAAGAAPGALITIDCSQSSNAETEVSVGSTRTFYLCIKTAATAPQTTFRLEISSTGASAAGVRTSPVQADTHTIFSSTLQIFKPKTATTGVGKNSHVVGAGAGPFALFSFNLRNRTAGEVQYNGMQITCTNVRGFVPGARGRLSADPLSYTGDIEKFVTNIDGSTNKNFNRRGTSTSAQLRNWSTEAPFYQIYIPVKKNPDDDGAADEEDPVIISSGGDRDMELHFHTNTYMSDLPSPGGVVPGDAWYSSLDSFAVVGVPKASSWVKNGNICILSTPVTSEMVYEIVGEIGAYRTLAHPHLDATASTYNDGSDLEFTSYRPLFAPVITGGPGNSQGLRQVTLVVHHRPGVDLTSETSPLRRVDQTEQSGFQLRRTDDGVYSMSDPLYPLDVSSTLITKVSPTQTRFDLVVAGFIPLPTDSAVRLNTTGQPRLWIGVEPSVHASFVDSISVHLPIGGLRFLSGLGVYETSALSYLRADDTLFQAREKLDTQVGYVWPLSETASLTFGMPVIFRDLTANGQSVPPLSRPFAVAGFNCWDSGVGARLTDLAFFVLDGALAGGGAIQEADFDSFANNWQSGWAVYKDNDGHPNNNNGVFDPDIDTFCNFLAIGPSNTRYVPIGNPYPSSTLSNYDALNQPMMVYLDIDATGDTARVPANDLGLNAGDDFFLVCRTSPTITPGDKFRVVVGDINNTIKNAYAGGLGFDTAFTGLTLVANDRVFSEGAVYRTDYVGYPFAASFVNEVSNDSVWNALGSSDVLRTELVSVNGGIAANVTNLIVGQKNVFRNNEIALFGVNLLDSGGGISLVSLTVAAIDSGTLGNFDTASDLAPFLTTAIRKGYGLAVFQDNGDSNAIYDSGDSVINGVWSVDSVSGGTTYFKFTFSPAWDMHDFDVDSHLGNDLYIVATLSDTVLYRDDFAFRIPENAFVFAPPGIISQPPPVTTSLMVGGMPSRILDLPDSGVLPTDGGRVAVIGFVAADTTFTGGGSSFLDKVRIRLDDPTAPGGFPTAILRSLTMDSSSGVAIWVDGNGNRKFDDDLTLDTCLPVVAFTWQSANILDVDVLNSAAAVPDTDAQNLKSDTAAVFFLVLRASADGLDHQVQVSLQAVQEPSDPWVKYTAPTDVSQSLVTNVLTIAPAGVSGTFSPLVFSPNSDGVTDTVAVALTVISGNPDSRWTLQAQKISSGENQTLGNGAFDSAVFIAATASSGAPPTFAWPSAFVYGGAFNLAFVYDRAGTSKTFAFGDTLLVDLHCTAPILTSTLPTVVTTGNTVAVSLSADTNRSGLDAFALTAGESAAQYFIYRLDGSVATLLVNGTLSNFVASNVSVPLQGGSNLLAAVLRDTYGNRSDTRELGTVTLSVGSNQTIVQDILTDPARRWLGVGESVAVLGINVTQDFPNEAITAFTLQIFDSGGFTIGQNIENIPVTGTYPETAGILIYRDNTTAGTKGSWDTQDVLVPMNPAQRNSSFVSGDTIRFIPQSPMSVPQNDTEAANQGYDYFVVVRGAGGRYFRDSFVLSMPANTAFEFATASPTRSNLASRVTSTPILTRVPRTFLDRTGTNDSITIGSNYKEIFGLNINDSTRAGDGGATLTSIALDFTIASGDTFNPAVLSYQVYRDSGSSNIGSFDRTTDSEVTTAVSILSPTRVLLTLSGANAGIPGHDVGNDSGPDFWVAIRPSVISLALSNRFSVAILPGNVVTTGDSPGGPGVVGSKQVTVPAGGLSTSFSPNPFSPNGDGFFDTAGYSLSFADTRGFRIVVNRVSNGDTLYNRTGYAKETTIVFAYSDSTTGWATDEYRITVTDTVTNVPSTEATLLVSDIAALTPTLPTSVPTSTSGSSISITVRVSERTENSIQRAQSRSERDSFQVVFDVNNGDTFVFTFGSLSSSSVDISQVVPLNVGANTIRVILEDRVGNVDTSLVFNVASGATITGNIGFEGNAPVFRYTPANTSFTFTFPTTVTGGTLEFYNISGERVRLINLAPGVSQVDWNAANDAAQLLRNGVYVIKFKVPLSDGRTIEEARTIFLLK